MKTDILLGAHVSIAGSIDQSVDRAQELDCTTFQIFTRSPHRWNYEQLNPEAVSTFRKKLSKSGIKVAVVHMPYLPNLASPDTKVHSESARSLAEELKRADTLGLPYVVTHLGSHMGRGIELGQKKVAEALVQAMNDGSSGSMILLENMAGQKNSVGASFSDIGKIIDLAGGDHRIGVCLDTCHAYAAGIDIATPGGMDSALSDFDSKVGLKRLKVIHLNDSKGGLGSGLDRHENIGRGHIGLSGFRAILSRKEIRHLPMILETPVGDYTDFKKDMQTVLKILSQTQ